MKRNTIRHTLFFTYSAVILAAFFAVGVLFAGMELPKQKEQAFSSLKQNCSSITASMDREFDQMHTFALNIAYSTLVRDRLVGYMSSDSSAYTKEADAKVLGDLLAALICPNRPADQIFLYTLQDEVVASGLVNGTFYEVAAQQPWFDTVRQDANHKAMLYTGTDTALSRYSTGIYGKHFVSLALQIFDVFNGSQGYVEIKKSLSKIIPAAIAYDSVFGEQIYIFDGSGSLIFPLGAAPPATLYSSAQEQGFPAEVTTFSSAGAQEYYVCAPSLRSNFCTIAVISENALLSPGYAYLKRTAFVTLIALFLALGLAFFAAKRLTIPLAEICDEVSGFDLSQLTQLELEPAPLFAPDIKIIELKSLHQSFYDMRLKLRESINRQLLLQNQEMQSRMIALQSQMNPHFLYNSLSAIQSMADEGMNRDIITMCQSMAGILRYISSNTEQQVSLDEELQCTQDYLACMNARYQGDLSYSIAIPPEMYSVKVPKLCVQLLVENAIKFSAANRPPYHVSITGEKNDSYYSISIIDNGPGFSAEAIELLHEKIAEIDSTGLLPSLEINGMGLMNVYLRYKLLHNENVIFRIENHLPHGACITIGEWYEES